MYSNSKISILCLAICLITQLSATNINSKNLFAPYSFQDDSTRTILLLESVDLNLKNLNDKSSDSIALFQNLSLLYAELEQPKEAKEFAERYIRASADLSLLNRDSFNSIKNTEEFMELEANYNIDIDWLVLIYLYIAFIGFFFAIVINFKKKSDRISNFLIGGFVIVHSLFILDFALFSSNIRYYFPHVMLMSSSVSLLYGPFLYLYFRRITVRSKLKTIDLLHSVPFVILLLVLLPFYQISAGEKLKVMFDISEQFSSDNLFFTVFIPKLLSYIIYGALISRLYFKEKNKAMYSNQGILDKWKRNIYRIHILYMFSYAIYGMSIKGILIDQSIFIYHSQMLCMSFMVLYIAQMAYVRPRLFDYKTIMNISDYINSKYSKSGLTDSLSEELKSNLLKLLTVDKVYKDCNINLETLSAKLETTRHNASQLINEQFDMNFFELINKFRIEEAKAILRDDTNGNLNIIDIAYEVGYNNKVTFNKAFKKETSLTPTQFINNPKHKNSTGKHKGIFSRA